MTIALEGQPDWNSTEVCTVGYVWSEDHGLAVRSLEVVQKCGGSSGRLR